MDLIDHTRYIALLFGVILLAALFVREMRRLRRPEEILSETLLVWSQVALLPIAVRPTGMAVLREGLHEGGDATLREALEAVADGLVIYGTNGVVTYANDAAIHHFGVRIGERFDFGGPDLQEEQLWQRDHGETPLPRQSVAAQVILTGRRVPPAEHQLSCPDGRTMKVQVTVAPLRSPDGELSGAVCTMHDLHARLQQEQDRMETWRGDLLRRMAGGIAHDYNNFLTVILGNLSLAREAAADRPDLVEAIGAIEEASLNAKDLTRQLLAISRGDALAPGTADLGVIVSRARRRAVADRRIRCDVSIPDGMPTVAMNPEALQQVLEEILISAAGSMPTGGTVRVVAQPDAAGIVLSVIDEGVGFPEHDLPHVFDPYFTTWHRGHGLGLASSRAIVEQYGGTIGVESAPGIGTTFRLQLPVRQGPARPAVQRSTGVRRVLLMDDEPGVLQVAARMLRRLGHDVVTAVDGADAVRKFIRAEAAGTPVDLAILDLTVPGGTGGEVAAQRLHEMSPDLPLIVSSGYASGDVLTHYDRYGFSGVILKPYRLEELAQGLSQALPQAAPPVEQPKLWD
ncbi:MAG: ATP-binding protein [Thermaerobacter sp.]|nr:ATP-binding protein [Thermaerobacter sp.]